MKKMKKISAVMVALIMALCLMAFSAVAADDDFVYEFYGEGTIEIISCWQDGGDIEILAKIDGKKVVSIANGTFAYNSMTSITIPVTVKNIGAYAFEGCEYLTDVYYTGSAAQWKEIIIGVDNYPLLDAEINFVKAVCSHENVIEYEANEPTCAEYGYTAGKFCSDCETWIEGHNVITAEGHTDENTDGFCDVCEEYLSEVVETGKCGDNVNYILYEDGTLIIGGRGDTYNYRNSDNNYSPFWYSNVKKIVIQGGVQSIGNHLFENCFELQVITIPNSLTNIGESAFCGCINLASIEMPDSITCIGVSAFFGCTRLSSVRVSVNITILEGHVFNGCNNLTSVEIPDNVTSIGTCAFYKCGNLESIIIPDNVISIGSYAFCDCSNLKNVTIGNKVKSIGSDAFDDCTSLTSIRIPDSVVSIGGYAFRGCKNLKSIMFPDSVISVGIYAFYNCPELKEVLYGGTIEQWYEISVVDYNGCLQDSMIYYNHFNSHLMSPLVSTDNGTHIRYCQNEYPCPYTETSDCTYGEWIVNKSATCTETGSKSKNCTVCGYIVTEVIDKIPHTEAEPVAENRIDPKCEVKGSYDEVVCCLICDTELSRTVKEIPALTHSWNDGVVNPVSTCKTHGTKTYTCQNDVSHKKTEQIVLDANNHEGGTYVKNVCESTCTTEGYTGDIYCVGCDTKLETGKPIDKLAHTFADKIIENKVDATCEDIGSYDEVVYCSVCDAELSRETEVVDAFGHDEINYEAKAPTCTESGWNAYVTCSRCDYTTYEETGATGHDYDSVVTAPACDSIGYTTHTCLDCGEVYTDTFVNANGHKGGTATCTDKAKCSVCGEAYGSLKAHTYKTVTTKATLSKNGKIESKCSCGKVKSTQTFAKISSVTLSATKYIHDGKNKTPTVTVKDANGKTLVKNTDYKLSVASSRKGIGKYTVKVTFIGKYEGTKNVYFTILPGKPASVKSAAQTTSSVKLTWSKVSGAAGYTVYRYSPSKKAYVKAGTTEGTSLTVKGLLAGTKYTFKVVAYGKTSGGKVYNSEGYTLLKTATKTKTPAISKITTTKGKAVLTHTNVSGETGYTVYYSTKKDSGFKKYNNFKADTTTCNITKLTSGKTYYFKVRTYIKTDSGYVYSPWSAVKGIKVK